MAGRIAGNGGGWFLCLEACVAFSILKALIPGGHGLVYWFLDLFLCGHRFYARAVGRVGSMHTIATWSWRLRTIRMAILAYFLLYRVSLFMDIFLRQMNCY